MCAVKLAGAELLRVCLITNGPLSDSGGSVSDAICGVYHSFPVNASPGASVPSAEGPSDRAYMRFVVSSLLLFSIRK